MLTGIGLSVFGPVDLPFDVQLACLWRAKVYACTSLRWSLRVSVRCARVRVRSASLFVLVFVFIFVFVFVIARAFPFGFVVVVVFVLVRVLVLSLVLVLVCMCDPQPFGLKPLWLKLAISPRAVCRDPPP